ncbi:MAG TPA: fluoride efflux transporter CrcB [Paenalcaligenes sp.]|nr:fluoride efflux transporter CrcB [Paenalcaligenes sp.]
MIKALLSIVLGSSLGGLLRWGLSVKFNALWSVMPLGTYLANVIAGYVAGLALAFFSHLPSLSPEWRLFLLTGFCGALSTFSTFSLEVVQSFQNDRVFSGLVIIFLHLLSSLLMTYLGFLTYQSWQSS